jgi:hypothetical protein
VNWEFEGFNVHEASFAASGRLHRCHDRPWQIAGDLRGVLGHSCFWKARNSTRGLSDVLGSSADSNSKARALRSLRPHSWIEREVP